MEGLVDSRDLERGGEGYGFGG
jgi:hypothetical protein